MKRILLLILVAMLFVGLTIWLAARNDNQRQSVDSVVFQPLPTPKIETLQKQLYEEWQREKAKKEAKEAAEKKLAEAKGSKKK
ncbi:hypothetical protein KJ590_01835 [Patescibacteria group bacterium]|nr:hypothetical protein [Patescibacteria group bacterium]